MKKMAKFEKVSFEQFKKDWKDVFGNKYNNEDDFEKDVIDVYNSIKLPKRATIGSAGYDFFMPHDLMLFKNNAVKIPTGIRCYMDDGWTLECYPRSSLGFKYGVSMANTVPVVDLDYYNADNEGHIFIKLVNANGVLAKDVYFEKGDAFCQGIFHPFGITFDDDVIDERKGGLGSTGR